MELITFVLIFSILINIGLTADPDPTVRLDDIPAPYSYVIKSDGTNYWGVSSEGEMVYESTNASYTINSALSGLTSARTWQETVLLTGNFTIDSSIVVYAYTYLQLIGHVSLADNSNCDMIKNAHPESNDICVTIEGGGWWGNKGQQTSGCGINWTHSVSISEPTGARIQVTFRDLTIKECKEHGIFVDLYGAWCPIDIEGVNSKWHGGAGVYLKFVADFQITNCFALDGDGAGIVLMASGIGQIGNCYINDGIVVDGLYGASSGSLQVSNCYIDAGARHGLTLNGCQYSTFSNLEIHMWGTTPKNNDAIYLDTYSNPFYTYHSVNNTFSNIIIDNHGFEGTWRYGVHESNSSQTANTYNGVHVMDGAVNTGGFLLNGLTSHMTSCWNESTFIRDSWVNSGTATISASTQTTFNHGLAGTPEIVLASFNVTTYNGYTWSATSTQITITVGTSGDYEIYWYAEYKP